MKHVLAVDIGGSKLVCGIVAEDGSVLRTAGEPLCKEDGLEGLLLAIERCGQAVMGRETLCAVGATIPGLADAVNGLWVYAPFSGLANIPIAALLQERFQLPVAIENDVNACALAERRWGACQAIGDYLWMTVSNGVGGALVLRHALYTGSCGNAGEVGHLCVEENADRALPCGCGRCGCLEAMASGQGIMKRYGEPGVTAKEVGLRARAGEAKAQAVMADTGRYLGRAIADCINVLNPAAVILGGGVALDFDLLEPALRETVAKRLFTRANPSVILRVTGLGYHAALLGAATLALEGLQQN
jgi:glucokinase